MNTIFAPITSYMGGSTIIVRISGSDALKIKEVLKIKQNLKARYAHLTKLYDFNDEIIDQAIVTYFPAPNSYTGEDVVEIAIHASKAIYQQLINILEEIEGFTFAEAGEFTKRAFLNDKIDLLQAEAIADLISSETSLQAKQALEQLEGVLSNELEEWRNQLIDIRAFIEAYIDFPEEDIPEEKISEAESLMNELEGKVARKLSDHLGEIIHEGVKIAIVGPPNSGKSSLLNNLAGRDIAIVSDIAGTTRDSIELHLDIKGFPVNLSDTAGIRDTNDEVEKIGIKRSIAKAQESDFKIFIISYEEIYKIKDYQNLLDDNTIIVVNKIDLIMKNDDEIPKEYQGISVKNNIGINSLIDKIYKKITDTYLISEIAPITRERHRKLFELISNELSEIDFNSDLELVAEKLRRISNLLGRVIGKIDVEDILDSIFSKFCIGK